MLTMLQRSHLSDTEVWACGSRVNGPAHEGSDLDLFLRRPGLEEIPSERLMDIEDLEDAIRESTIPYSSRRGTGRGFPSRSGGRSSVSMWFLVRVPACGG